MVVSSTKEFRALQRVRACTLPPLGASGCLADLTLQTTGFSRPPRVLDFREFPPTAVDVPSLKPKEEVAEPPVISSPPTETAQNSTKPTVVWPRFSSGGIERRRVPAIVV